MAKQDQSSSVPVMTRLSPNLNQQVEDLVKRGGYRNKSNFLEEAIRVFVEQRARQQPVASEAPLVQSHQ